MYRSPDGVVTFGMHDWALNKIDPVSTKRVRKPFTGPLETFIVDIICPSGEQWLPDDLFKQASDDKINWMCASVANQRVLTCDKNELTSILLHLISDP